jgi:hypothetical protein
LVDRVVQLIADHRASALLGLVVENAEQPGADLGAPFKPLNRLDERHEDVLHEILGLALRMTHAPGSPVESPALLVNNGPQGLGVAAAQAPQVRVVELDHEPIIPTLAAGFTPEDDAATPGGTVLIDTHATEIASPAWDLYAYALGRFGLKPTLIEWDNEIPAFTTLLDQAATADAVAAKTLEPEARRVAAR